MLPISRKLQATAILLLGGSSALFACTITPTDALTYATSDAGITTPAPRADAAADSAPDAAPPAPVDGCKTNHGGCDPNATCASTDAGASSCTCNANYTGDGKTCQGIDACAVMNGGCAATAACTSTGPDTKTCACNSGYAGDGTSCSAIDDCATGNGGCDSNAACTSTGPGTHSCACNSGYSGDGSACTSIDPCLTASGGCDVNASCTHTGPATSTCACNSGYQGDGTSCSPVFALTELFPFQGMDLSSSGGYVILLGFNAPYSFTGGGSATLEDLTASTSMDLPASGSQNWGSPNNLGLFVDNGAPHSPAHTYRVTVSSDFITGFAGTTWTYLR